MFRSSGLVFEWKAPIGVEPPATNLRDRSRFGSDGAFVAAGRPDWVQEPSGLWVLDFTPGNPDYIEIPADQTQLNFTSEDFSIITRVKVDSLSVNRGIFVRGFYQQDGYEWIALDNGRLQFSTYQSGVAQYSRSDVGIIVTDTWYTLGISRNGSSVKIFRNGIDITTTIGTHENPASSTRSAKIGIEDNLTGNPFDGKIAYLAIWNYALSAGQHLKKHYKLSQFGV